MSSIPASQIKRGQVINWEGALWAIVSYNHVKLAKGGGAMQMKLKNLKRGDHRDQRFRSSEKLEVAFLDKKTAEYLYPEGDSFVFMDTEDFEQFNLSEEMVGELMPYVKLNSSVQVTFYEGLPISVDLPAAVELTIIETEPGFKGDTVNNTYKPAKVETGLEVKVPNHISVDDVVKVSTDTGEFMERVNS